MKVFMTVKNTMTGVEVGKCVCDNIDVAKVRRAVAAANGDKLGMNHIAFSCNVSDEYMMKVCNPNGYDLQLLEAAYDTFVEKPNA